MSRAARARLVAAPLLAAVVLSLAPAPARRPAALVFQSDFGLLDGSVAAMKGVAFGVSPDLRMFDLTHNIPPFNVWEAAYRLRQTAPYWPPGTVFVSVVDPGVGTSRRSVVLRTRTGHYFVSPDNGTLTLVAEAMGVDEVREIDERVNRRPGSERSYTFHGRDVYAYTGARLAAGAITFAQVGPRRGDSVVRLDYQPPALVDSAALGIVPILDLPYGNVWTNVDADTFARLGVRVGDQVAVRLVHGRDTVFAGDVPYVRSFGDVPAGAPLLYLNSLLDVALALNQGNFAERYRVGAGPDWRVVLRRAASR
jgi:S-adenosylmethionine hydrolase